MTMLLMNWLDQKLKRENCCVALNELVYYFIILFLNKLRILIFEKTFVYHSLQLNMVLPYLNDFFFKQNILIFTSISEILTII